MIGSTLTHAGVTVNVGVVGSGSTRSVTVRDVIALLEGADPSVLDGVEVIQLTSHGSVVDCYLISDLVSALHGSEYAALKSALGSL